MDQATAGLVGAAIGVSGTALTALATAWAARFNHDRQRQQVRRQEQREAFAALLAAAYGMQATDPRRKSTYRHERVPPPPGHRGIWVQPINESHLDQAWADAVHREADRVALQMPLIALSGLQLYSEARRINDVAEDLARQIRQNSGDAGHAVRNFYASLGVAVDRFTEAAARHLADT
ncbi:hypothetical protein OHA98_36210 [Streptomyces sp. NBC_00654]|uniref:hypothetical protein n=1 Tax=Streptomyces sp. NBC_00654 TaxID=2975799 RepID=UPI00224D3DE7|nr:hypothetical protein [Streptomyces sp. NBC_00654]MCX4970108.1 hypothetical protein [Streptomyces sp. NBC_00654]